MSTKPHKVKESKQPELFMGKKRSPRIRKGKPIGPRPDWVGVQGWVEKELPVQTTKKYGASGQPTPRPGYMRTETRNANRENVPNNSSSGEPAASEKRPLDLDPCAFKSTAMRQIIESMRDGKQISADKVSVDFNAELMEMVPPASGLSEANQPNLPLGDPAYIAWLGSNDSEFTSSLYPGESTTMQMHSPAVERMTAALSPKVPRPRQPRNNATAAARRNGSSGPAAKSRPRAGAGPSSLRLPTDGSLYVHTEPVPQASRSHASRSPSPTRASRPSFAQRPPARVPSPARAVGVSSSSSGRARSPHPVDNRRAPSPVPSTPGSSARGGRIANVFSAEPAARTGPRSSVATRIHGIDSSVPLRLQVRLHSQQQQAGEQPLPNPRQDPIVVYNRQFSGLQATGASGMTILEELIDLALRACEKFRLARPGEEFPSRGAALLGPEGRVYTGVDVYSHESDLHAISAERAAVLAATQDGVPAYAPAGGAPCFDCCVIVSDTLEQFPVPDGRTREFIRGYGNFPVILVNANLEIKHSSTQV